MRVLFRVLLGGGADGGRGPARPAGDPAPGLGARPAPPRPRHPRVAPGRAVRRPAAGTIVVCVGAANALANPKRLLRSVPAALHEVGTALVVAVTVLPQLADSARRVRAAQALRAGDTRRTGRLRRFLVPVLEDALERSLRLAAGMDTRGYGRSGGASPAERRLTGGLMLVGLCGVCVGVYAGLDHTAPRVLATPMLVLGVAAAVAGLVTAGRRVGRSTYRPDPWLWPEFGVMLSGIATAFLGWWVVGTPAPGGLPRPLHLPRGHPGRTPRLGARAARCGHRSRAPDGRGMSLLELRGIGFGYADAADPHRRRPGRRRGRADARHRPDRLGEVHAARHRDRPGAALLRRPPHGRRAARRHQHPGGAAARARARHRLRRPGPARRLRHRHGGGGARLRHGAARACLPRRCGAGSRRPSTCSASPTSGAATCARSPAASSNASPSARCSPCTRGCWSSTSRPPPSTRPRPRRCWPR